MTSQPQRFIDQIVVVTGGATGLGGAITTRLVQEGARVVVADIDEGSLATASERLGGGTDAVEVVTCDVSVRKETKQLITGVLQRHGQIDVLVNNAGVGSVGRIVDLGEDEWDRVLAVNAKGVFLCCQAALPGMLARERGSIVNIASQAGRRGLKYIAHYCAAKAAVINFTRALALEAAPHVRANSICPGTIATPMVERTLGQQSELEGVEVETLRQGVVDEIPLGRLQQPADIAAAVAFIASGDAGELTGQSLHVSGGVIMD